LGKRSRKTHHDEQEMRKGVLRPLAGERRKVAGKELMLKKPTRLRAEMFADADEQAMAHGNHTQVKSLGVLHHLRTETTAHGDYAKAVWPDLL
ncbi:unnamed protein product, partial [Allacma fusca]